MPTCPFCLQWPSCGWESWARRKPNECMLEVVKEWEGMKQLTRIISTAINTLCLPAFLGDLGLSNVILTSVYQAAIDCYQGEGAWKSEHSGSLCALVAYFRTLTAVAGCRVSTPHFASVFLVDGFVVGAMLVACAPGSLPKQVDQPPDMMPAISIVSTRG